MPYWMEIHCSVKYGSCHSNIQHDIPMSLTRDASLAAVNQAIFHLAKEAIELGWTYLNNDWVCPECKK